MFLCNNYAMYSISDVIYTDNSENRKNTKKRNSKPVPKCLILESVYLFPCGNAGEGNTSFGLMSGHRDMVCAGFRNGE